MFIKGISRLSAAVIVWCALAANVFCATSLSVTDQKGRSLAIELISLADNSVTFRRQGDPKEFTLPVTNFDQASQELIRKQAAQLPAVMPKIQPEIVIGKRRQDAAGSYYMVKQEITSTVKLTNLSTSAPVPALTGKIVFIGQNTSTPALLSVLSSQSFETSTIKPSETFTKETDAFSTSYDSDNKGSGNVGGYQYFGYIFALMDDAGNVILNLTTTGSFRLALTAKPDLIKQIVKMPKGTLLSDKLGPAPNAAKLKIPQ
ncbi:MAG: hypothetical protein V4819_08425 [Verrucomicrobiota bacterium]